MNFEAFDAQVRAKFEGETLTPPSHIESAVFSELSAWQLRKSRLRKALAVAVVAPALWVGLEWITVQPDNSGMNEAAVSDHALPFEEGISATPIQEEKSVNSEPLNVNDERVYETLQDVASDATVSRAHRDAPAHVKPDKSDALMPANEIVPGVEAMAPLEVLGVESLNAQDPALLEKREETWVMPGVVKIKE